MSKKEYKITPEGSLGLLALGDIGLKKWREVRGEVQLRTKENTDKNKTKENGEKDS